MTDQHDVAMAAAAITDALRDAVVDFNAWFEPLADSYSGRVGLYSQIADVAEALERAAAENGKQWGEDWDFYLSCDAAADRIARNVSSATDAGTYLVSLR